MGSILISVPDIADNELLFDDAETRQILAFFWPNEEGRINAMTLTNSARRLAQTALIAAIDGSYAMGFLDLTFRTLFSPGKSVKALGQKLARRFFRHWWRHATQRQLEDAKIYESVRVDIARALRLQLEECLEGLALRIKLNSIALVAWRDIQVWG